MDDYPDEPIVKQSYYESVFTKEYNIGLAHQKRMSVTPAPDSRASSLSRSRREEIQHHWKGSYKTMKPSNLWHAGL